MDEHATLLRRALRANAAFSAASGAALIALPGFWAATYGLPAPALYAGLGAALVAFATLVAWTSIDVAARWRIAGLVVAADGLWVLATPIVMLAAHRVIMPFGHVLLFLVAAVVGLLGWLQWQGLRGLVAASRVTP